MFNTSIKAVALANVNPDFVGKAWSKIRQVANVDARHKPALQVNLGATSTVHVYDHYSIIIIINLTITMFKKI